MWGITSITISPSTISSRRSTPWVDGCCGPILMIISSVRRDLPVEDIGGAMMVSDILQSFFSTELSFHCRIRVPDNLFGADNHPNRTAAIFGEDPDVPQS